MVRVKHRYLLVHILNPTTTVTSWTATPDDAPTSSTSRTLPPTVQFHPPTPPFLTASVLATAIRAQVALLFGDHGAGLTASSLSVKYLSPATATFIVRVARSHYRLVWAALSFFTRLPAPQPASASAKSSSAGVACVMRVVRVSGTIRKAAEEAVRRARDSMVRARAGGGLEAVLGAAEEGEDEEEEEGDEEEEGGESGRGRDREDRGNVATDDRAEDELVLSGASDSDMTD